MTSTGGKRYAMTRERAEHIFWVGFVIGLVWGHLLGISLGLWLAWR